MILCFEKTYSYSLSSHWLLVALEVGPCKIFSTHIGMLTVLTGVNKTGLFRHLYHWNFMSLEDTILQQAFWFPGSFHLNRSACILLLLQSLQCTRPVLSKSISIWKNSRCPGTWKCMLYVNNWKTDKKGRAMMRSRLARGEVAESDT